MSRFTILLGGDLVVTAAVERQVAGTRVIAADSGIRHAAALGLSPELWAGDFDSVEAEMLSENSSVPTARFPAEKDSTDGELAIDIALERGATSLVLVGAFGGTRADHAFLHMTAAIRLAETGVPVELTSGDQEGAPVLPGTTEFAYPNGTLFSILAFSELPALTLERAKWPLRDREVPFGSSLTLSNEVETSDTQGGPLVTLSEGRALLVAHPLATSGTE